jgi:hypothetical protein
MHARLSKRIINPRRIVDGPASDHDPISILKLQFKQKRRGIAPPKRTEMIISWDKLEDPETAEEFEQTARENLKQLASKGIPSAKAFSKAVVEAAEKTCPEDEAVKRGWFAAARTMLEPLVEATNKASEIQKEEPSEANNEIFRASRALLNKEVQRAKNRSEYEKAINIMETIQTRPRKAWKKM